MTTTLLQIDRLCVELPIGGKPRQILHDVSLSIAPGEAVGIVGESGSGKSTTLRAIARLLPPGAEMTGRVVFDGDDVLALQGEALRHFRASQVAVVSQDPRAAVNPVHKVGDALTEGLRLTRGVSRVAANERARELLAKVGIANSSGCMEKYPHQLSGGMLQRVMVAAALLSDPSLLLADEPTASLDVTTQSDVMALIAELSEEYGLALLFVTHDLELAAAVCNRTYVMYAGEIIETQGSAGLHEKPLHPYTSGLLNARPELSSRAGRLTTIPGRPLSAFEAPDGCRFAPRCAFCQPRCTQQHPELEGMGTGQVACVRAVEIQPQLASTGPVTSDG